jgi:hypothetical protein
MSSPAASALPLKVSGIGLTPFRSVVYLPILALSTIWEPQRRDGENSSKLKFFRFCLHCLACFADETVELPVRWTAAAFVERSALWPVSDRAT